MYTEISPPILFVFVINLLNYFGFLCTKMFTVRKITYIFWVHLLSSNMHNQHNILNLALQYHCLNTRIHIYDVSLSQVTPLSTIRATIYY